MTLGTRVAAGLALLLLLTASLVAYELLLTRRLHQANRQLASADLEASRTSLRLRRHLDRLGDLTERFLVLRDPGYPEELERLRRVAVADLRLLSRLQPDFLAPHWLLGWDSAWDRYVAAADELEPLIVQGAETEDTRQRLLFPLVELRDQVDALDVAAVARVTQSIQASGEAATAAGRAALIAGAVGLSLAALLALWIGRTTAGPLRSLVTGARAMASGDFAHRVEETGPPEIASLAVAFNDMARKLGELDAMKRDFLSNVSHDLKAPLASIQEATQLLLDQDSEHLTPEQLNLLRLNIQSAQRLKGMIADLLDVAQLEEGSVRFDFEPTDLIDCCEQALEQSGGVIAAKRLVVDRDWTGDPPLVEADPPMLLRALSNLISNAAKFSPEEGTVRLAVSRRLDDERVAGEAALLTIADEGPGVPPEDHERIFERFYRSAVHRRHGTGTGLGLAISRSIIERHGGTIWVENAPAGGSVSAVLLPTVDTSGRTG